MHQLADGSFSARGMSLRMYLSLADELRKRACAPLRAPSRLFSPRAAQI